MNELIKYINELPGYKISDTHFRLGSKIHISHFYYAKRFFQNSFFASRLAFLIAKEILTDHNEKISKIKTDGLTLIGYGLYSELLISLVEMFLKKVLSSKKINHDLISDADEPFFIKNYGDTYKYIVIIVPIASTFSTAIKIKEFLNDRLEDKVILEPYINVLHVSHSPSKLDEKPDENNLFKIEKNFGWTKKEGKIICIKDLSTGGSAGGEKKQKYLLRLKSEWYDVKNCSLCFPQEIGNDSDKERPLYFTDKSSVTPKLIFGKPKARKIEEDKNKFELLPKTLQYGHLIRNTKHFHYYIRIEAFFQENIENIQSWLDILKNKASFKKSFDETSKVIIIAPGHYSNAGFINLVNERLFSNAANIIHYNAQNDHILNFGLLYGKELHDKDTKVVFIDDTITTGSTFRKINFFVENNVIGNTSNGKVKAFDTCVVLLDRSNQNVHKQIKAKTNNYFSFANLHLPSLKDFDGECPLDIGYKRYNELANNSFLTRMKVHFLAQKDKLEERTINSKRNENYKFWQVNKESYIRQVEAVHRVYEWSRNPDHSFDPSFETWKKSLFDKTKSPFLIEKLHKNSTDEDGLSNETATLVKVLTHSPFIHYKPVKDNLFKWVLKMLKAQIDHIKNEVGNGGLKYKSFRDLKFLIRRAGLLNTNFLISEDIFEFLKQLYGDNGLKKLSAEIQNQIKNISVPGFAPTRTAQQTKLDFTNEKPKSKEELESILENIQDFHVFYTAQIKELLFLNEARSIRLEDTLNTLNTETDLPDSFKQLLRFIQEENGILILNFWNFIKKKFKSITYDELYKDNSIIEILKNNTVQEHYRAKILKKFLNLQSGEIKHLHENIPLINFLKLMRFFEIKRTEKNLMLNDKTSFIIDQLKEIVCPKNNTQIVTSIKSGAFFFVKYKKEENPFLAYNKGSSGELNDTTLKQDTYLKEFLNSTGNDKLTKTIIEFHKKEGKWYDLYAKDQNDKEFHSDLNFIPEGYNRLLIVRFSKLKVDLECKGTKDFKERLSNEGQAIVGFYFNKQDDKITNITKTRYLLLLCSPISAFIEKHHENDEFRDWIEADNRKRTELLTGHGREMLIDVATNHREYREIINIILLTQMLIINLQEEKAFKLKNNEQEGDGKTVINVFQNLFNPKGNSIIDQDYLERLRKMAEDIFSFEEIENKVENLDVECTNSSIVGSYKFPADILDMICFELLVNAKKNRWLFIDQEKFINDGKTYTNNKIGIKIETNNGSFILTISNTGPGGNDIMSKEIINKLNNGEDPKGYKSVAGLKLIQKLLAEFDLGHVEFSAEEISGLFYRFIVKLTLKSWDDGKQENITN